MFFPLRCDLGEGSLRDRITETVLPGSFFEMKGLQPYCSFQALRFQGGEIADMRSPTLSVRIVVLSLSRKAFQV